MENSKIDWTKKGRGWIPDPPDIRDYKIDHRNIQKDQRLRTEEVTGSIEDFVESLLKTLQSKFPTDQFNDLEQFQSRFSGGIYITKLKIYKTLRQQSKDNRPADMANLDEKSSRDLQSTQLSKLKQYLSFLVLKGYLQQPSPNDLKKPFFTNLKFPNPDFDLNTPLRIARWLRSNDFDNTTKQLVMLFQLYSHIRVDGIVGFESYTTLNEYFSDDSNDLNLKNLKKYADSYKKLTKEYEEKLNDRSLQSSQQKKIKIKLQTIPMLIPDEVFNTFFTEVKEVALNQTLQEFSSGLDQENETTKNKLIKSFTNLGEETDLDLPTCISLSERLEVICTQYSDSDDYFRGNSREECKKFLEKILADNQLSLPSSKNDKIAELLLTEFYTIEPIFLMVFKAISPLANYKNSSIKEVVRWGFQGFLKLLHSSYLLEQLSQTPDIASTENIFKFIAEDERKDLEQQAQEAVKKVHQLFKESIELIREDIDLKEDEEKFNRTLLFYLLIKKFINSLSPHIDPINQSDDEPNCFDKQDFFVIQSMPDESPQAKGQIKLNKDCEELFQTGELVIPVSDSFLNLTDLKKSKSQKAPTEPKLYFFLPGFVDLSFWCPEIRDQGSLNSCTALAGTALFEYFVNRSSGQYDCVSPLFLYKVARQLMQVGGDAGASVRDTMKAMAIYGMPPEEFWPYEEAKLDVEPPPFCYAYAKKFEALKYFRLDYADIPKDILLFEIKAMLTAGFPCMFGFTLYSSALKDPNPKNGFIPFPDVEKDKVVDGHAVLAVGYDDNKILRRANPEELPTRGAILIRNSWGANWGKQGYGWLPYEYVLEGLTSAWWSLLKANWFKGYGFGLGGKGGTNTQCGQPGASC